MSLSLNYPTIRPSLLLDFSNVSKIDPRITFSRASSATYYDSNGLLRSVSSNTPRLDYNPATLAAQGLLIEEQRVNLLTYSSDFDNAGWTKTNATVGANVVASPTGNADADKLIENTATSTHRVYQTVAGTTNTNPYTFSVFAKADTRTRMYMAIVEGATFIRQGNAVFDLSAGTIVAATSGSGGATGGSATIQNVGNGWYRCTYTLTLGGTDTVILDDLQLVSTGTTNNYTGNGVSGLFLYGAQLEAGAFATSYAPSANTFTSRASTGSFFDATGTLQSAAINVARNTYNPANLAAQPFLLLEEARTNSIRNNTMVGAVAGTPGTLPTNWAASGLGTLTQQVVGTGTSNGITYIDVRFSGTTSTTQVGIRLEPVNGAAGTNGQTFTFSSWVARVAGSTSNIGDISANANIYDSGSGYLTTLILTGYPTTVPTTLSRVSGTSTIASASAAFIQPQIYLTFASGVAIDITLRIGLPQLEQGAFATSVIPTSTTALTRAADLSSSAQATRAADIASVNTLSPWYNASEGTLYAEGSRIAAGLTSGVMTGFAQTLTFNQSIYIANDSGTGNSLSMNVINGGVAQAGVGGIVATGITNTFKAALAYAENNFAGVINGATPFTDVSGTVPTPMQVLSIGCSPWQANGAINWSGYLRRITFYPRRLSNAELQSLTS